VRLALLVVLVACERERDSQPAPPPPPPPVPPPAPVTRDCRLATPAMPDAARTFAAVVDAVDPATDPPKSVVASLIAWDRSGAAFPVGCEVRDPKLWQLRAIAEMALIATADGDADAEHAMLRLAAELRAPTNSGHAIQLGLGLADQRRYLQRPPGDAAHTFAPADDAPFLMIRNDMRCRLAEKSSLDRAALDAELILVFDGHGHQITTFSPADKQRLLDERRQSMAMTITPDWYTDEVPALHRFLADTCARVLDAHDATAIRKLHTELEATVRHPTSMLVRLVGSGVSDAKGDIYLEQAINDVAAYRAWLAGS
jgi:hypothetical protein